jgi:hypothetical protein
MANVNGSIQEMARSLQEIEDGMEEVLRDYREGRITLEEKKNRMAHLKQQLIIQLDAQRQYMMDELERRQAALAVPAANTGCKGSGCAIMGGSRRVRKTRKYRKSRKNRK